MEGLDFAAGLHIAEGLDVATGVHVAVGLKFERLWRHFLFTSSNSSKFIIGQVLSAGFEVPADSDFAVGLKKLPGKAGHPC